jgi:hypothetical protein
LSEAVGAEVCTNAPCIGCC